jgi:hypothetical protein
MPSNGKVGAPCRATISQSNANATLDFETLVQLAGSKSPTDVPCPLCGPDRSTQATRRKPVLRIWHPAPDFATFACARCGKKGWAAARRAEAVNRRELARRMQAAEEHRAETEAERRGKARWLWSESDPINGTVAEAYLRHRGITVVPPTLRFLAPRGTHGPAMLAAFGHPIELEPGRYELALSAVHAVHITKLKFNGSGKAPDGLGRSKIVVGVTGGWPLALAPPNDGGGLAVAEGIENALWLHQATRLGAWASGSAVRLPKIAPLIAQLSYIEAVTIGADDDPAGRQYAQELGRELVRLRPDIDIRIAQPMGISDAAA